MPTVKMTSRTVPTLPRPHSAQVDYFDSSLPGFGLRVSPSGRRSYTLLYRHLGRLRRLTLGQHPALALADARDLAKKALVELAQGKDPGARKIEARRSSDFRALAERFLEANRQRLRPKTLTEWERILNREIAPQLGHLPPQEISRARVRDLCRTISMRAPYMGNRVFEVIRRIFTWAVSEDLLETSPCLGLRKPCAEKSRERVLSSEEIRRVYASLEEERPIISGFFKILFFMATRRSEVLGARWPDIDFEQKLWTIPETKGGRQHVLPLSSQAAALLEMLRPLAGHSQWIFLGPTGKAIAHPQKAVARIRARSGVQFRIHDIRRTVATGLASIGVPSPVISRILNHVPGGPAATRIYDRYEPLPEMRSALEAWATHLQTIVHRPV